MRAGFVSSFLLNDSLFEESGVHPRYPNPISLSTNYLNPISKLAESDLQDTRSDLQNTQPDLQNTRPDLQISRIRSTRYPIRSANYPIRSTNYPNPIQMHPIEIVKI